MNYKTFQDSDTLYMQTVDLNTLTTFQNKIEIKAIFTTKNYSSDEIRLHFALLIRYYLVTIEPSLSGAP